MLKDYVWNLPYFEAVTDGMTEQEYEDYANELEPVVSNMRMDQYCVLLLWLYDSDTQLAFTDFVMEASQMSNQECLEVFKDYLEGPDHAWFRDDWFCEGDDLYDEVLGFVKEEVK